MAFGILATMRNEAPFILEWLAFHQVIGFEKFLIFSNDSTDGTTEILDALADAGQIKHVYHSLENESGKLWTLIGQRAFNEQFFDENDWIIWLDVDEFLNIKVGDKSIHALRDAIGTHDAILVSWRVFGDAGHMIYDGSLISERYTRAEALPADKEATMSSTYKAFFRHGNGVLGFANHGPIYDPKISPKLRVLNSDVKTLTPGVGIYKAWKRLRTKSRLVGEFERPKQLSAVQINHYMVRSRRLFREKAKRGRIGGPGGPGDRYNRHTYVGFNLNEVDDDSILPLAAATAERRRHLYSLIRDDCDLKGILSSHYDNRFININSFEEFKGSKETVMNDQKPKADEGTSLYTQLHDDHINESDSKYHGNKFLADAIVKFVKVKTCIDIGCGPGFLLKHLEEAGMKTTGIEGPWLTEENKISKRSKYIIKDLEKPLNFKNRFGLCVSIDVAEHLEPERAESFVEELTEFSDIVVFSAAIPGQGGEGHKNEQWQSYWAKLFEKRSFLAFDILRPELAKSKIGLWWLRQNTILYAKSSSKIATELSDYATPPENLDYAISLVFHKNMRRMRRKIKLLKQQQGN